MSMLIEQTVPPAPEGTYAHNPTMAAEAISLFIEFFRKPRNAEFIRVVVNQVQQSEDVYNQLMLAFDVDTAEGDQLDKIGAWVGQPRSDGQDDTQYRQYIYARILVNQTTGTLNHLLLIVSEIGAPPQNVREAYPATLIFEYAWNDDVDQLIHFLRAAKPAGVSLMIVQDTTPPADAFRWRTVSEAGFAVTNSFGTVAGYPTDGGKWARVLV